VDPLAATPMAAAAPERESHSFSFDRWAKHMADRCEHNLANVLPAACVHPANLHEGMRYAVLGGGKRVRPLLVYAAGELSGAPLEVLDGAACAVELIHAYSLVHDDMPCMDNDVLRRGKPTVHVAYGEANAMLVGDALQALAFSALVMPMMSPLETNSKDLASARVTQVFPVAKMVQELALAAGSNGMAGGQAIDLAATGATLAQEQLKLMHQLKTGAMLGVSVRLGLLAGGEDATKPRENGKIHTPDRVKFGSQSLLDMQVALDLYSTKIGLAFQVVDDILDVEADSATLGKTAGKDLDQGKSTYVSILGLAQAKALLGDLHAQALAAIEPFGDSARRLAQLADLIVLRKS
jgi:farnesyl diphosphate synthase